METFLSIVVLVIFLYFTGLVIKVFLERENDGADRDD